MALQLHRSDDLNMIPRLFLPPFSPENAELLVHATAEIWNSCDALKVAELFSEDSQWRNRSKFLAGRSEITLFLQRKWEVELNFRFQADLWCARNDRLAIQVEYEWCNSAGFWYRSYGNELWQYNKEGLITHRFASTNDLPIKIQDRKLLWEK